MPVHAQQQAAAQAQPAQKAAPKSSKKAAPADQAAKPKQDPAAAKSLVENGIASVQAGKLDVGINQLSTALSGGGLPSQDMARALYYRGAAYRKQSKPALAISDLTSALWLKNGLKDGERQDAQAQRSAAYREAGLPDQTPAGSTAAEPRSIVAAVPGKGSSTAAAPSAPAKAASTASTASAASATAMTPAERRAAEVAETRTETARAGAAPAESSSSEGGGIGGFFGNLFGGSSSAQKPMETASTPPPSPPQASSWSTTTSDKPATAAKAATKTKAEAPTKVASAAPVAAKGAAAAAPAAASASSAGAGKFMLQVASARSRPEAEAVAQKLRQQLGADIGGRSTEISEASFGGTSYYRVKLGTFATSEEPRALCGKLRQQGFDCLIVTQ